ncbi:MAG: helix-turn-helix domain-containing protein [Jiangellaceae bacterium]
MIGPPSQSVHPRPGDLVRAVRRRKGLTQVQLALRAGTTQSAVSRIERGDESPTVARLADLLLAMGAQLTIATVPIDPWANLEDLLADRRRTPAERLADGIRLSTFATELAGAARTVARD